MYLNGILLLLKCKTAAKGRILKMDKKQNVQTAIYLGTLCSVAYLMVYLARNLLSAVTPQLIENGFSEAYIGKASSFFFILYAAGQFINGLIGNKIKGRHMICIGLFMAAVTNLLFAYYIKVTQVAPVLYGLLGFFLAMIFAPMIKLVTENTEPKHAVRCSLAYSFASYFGSPLAGVFAAVMAWQGVFISGSLLLSVMALVCFICFLRMERQGAISYHQYDAPKREGGSIKTLVSHGIIRFTFVAFLTGIIRTSVVFWMPTYIAQYLGFSAEHAAIVFTVATFCISFVTFIAAFVYERLGHRVKLTLFLMFGLSALFFGLLFFVRQPVINIILLVLAIMAANGASTIIWSIYCPGLRNTGMTSVATGFLDCVSYIGAAVSSTLFANAVTQIGWGNLILVWCGLMVLGVVVSSPGLRQELKRT